MGSTGSPCGACKFLRRKCAPDCVFAPYFTNEHGAARFAAIHRVFGASNAAKLLSHVPQPNRCEAVLTIAYEAQARLRDPVYGCVSHIFALQHQVASLQTQLMQAKAQIAREMASAYDPLMTAPYGYGLQSVSPQSSIDCANRDGLQIPEVACFGEGEELRALAVRMMRN